MKKSKEFIKLCKEYGVDPNNVNEVPSFEAACAITGNDAAILPQVSLIPTRHQKRLIADYMLSIIGDALRGDWMPNYNDWSQPKYFAIFEVEASESCPSGSALSYVVYAHWLTFSTVGVRLCFPNSDTARFFGKHFIKLHIDHHLLT